jgi:chemotaxis protein CheC
MSRSRPEPTDMPDVALDELERDALTELVNIGVSRAAASLRKMVGREVLLSIPAIDAVSRKTAAALIGERESEDLVAVHQDFTGAFSGRALLIFPQSTSLQLVRAVAGPDLDPTELAEMEHEALAETGNVILNGCLGSMANMLKQSLSMSLPEVLQGSSADLFATDDDSGRDGMVLFLYINFSVQDRDIRGYIAMLMDLPSLAALKQLIGEFIDSVMTDEPADG